MTSLRALLFRAVLFLGVTALAGLSQAAVQPRVERDLSGPGWRLWYDKDAAYQGDALMLPPVDLASLPSHAPTGGWDALGRTDALEVSVPGTAEEYLQKTPGPAGDIKGVTWWWRRVQIPSFPPGSRVLLRFEAARQRAEVFVDRRLVGYDMIGNAPFEADVTGAVSPGKTVELAVRITDAGGNFDWRDGSHYRWGDNDVLMSHGFGGLTGGVTLVVCPPAYVDDVAVLNTPAITQVKVLVDLKNTLHESTTRDVLVRVVEAGGAGLEVARAERRQIGLAPDAVTSLEIPISAPQAKLWDLEHPNLYRCEVTLADGGRTADAASRRFGFRWFAPEGVGKDAVFRLNGKRIVLRTAISWGFWPVNGITPTPALAEREVRVAKELGLNMLNFHRCIGQASVLDKADELGLLFFEEPGNWKGGDGGGMPRAMAHEKLLRMVRRDRSHPSLVIYNLINEDGNVNAADLAAREADLRAAHRVDPSRVITRTSGWARAGAGVDDPMKMHLRPCDDQLYLKGWYDFHHAGGPATWNDDFYTDPSRYYNRTDDRAEIVYWGEEGAISSPPRLGMIRAELLKSPQLGWDGAAYLDFYRQFDDFITRKGLRQAFPTVDALTGAMGNVSLEHQGRKIQLIRIGDAADGYAINGWESELIENHSGVVDCFRNPKGDPSLLARYNRPAYVAVMPRAQVGRVGGATKVDFFLVNEIGLTGRCELSVEVTDANGQRLLREKRPVEVEGGERYGQLLLEGLEVPYGQADGYVTIRAQLRAPDARVVDGDERLFCVDWRSTRVAGRGAVFGSVPGVREFLGEASGASVPAYRDDLGRLDWVVVTRAPAADLLRPMPSEQLRRAGGAGVQVSFFGDREFARQVCARVDPEVNLNVAEGATPDAAFPGTDAYNVRWETEFTPALAGTYSFAIAAGGGGVRLTVAGQRLIDGLAARGRQAADRVTIDLAAGRPVSVVVEYAHQKGAGRCRLLWAPPVSNPPDLDRLMARVRDQGTKLVILDFADSWMSLLEKSAPFHYAGSFKVGTAWIGGLHFVKAHPLVEGLPSNDAMGWPYQALVRNGQERKALLLEGEEFVAGAWHCQEEKVPMRLGTVLGVIPCGKGAVVFSTLDVSENLRNPDGPCEAARKLLCNMIAYKR